MERCLGNSPSMDNDDGKYVSGLSTILVATIQEAKDRISQIEYIFCSQLFPNIQNRSKRLQKILSEARKTAEDELRKEQNNLVAQLKKLQFENEQVLQENHALRMDQERLLKEKEEEKNMQRDLEKRIGDLEVELQEKSVEVVEGMKLERKLLQLVQETKFNAQTDRAQQAKQLEEVKSGKLVDLQCLQMKIEELELGLKQKNEELAKGKGLLENLLRKMRSWELKLMGSKFINDDRKKEGGNGFITIVERVDMLADKLWEDKVNRLQVDLKMRENEVDEGRKLQENFLRKLESKDEELLSERKKIKDAIASYKKLKSQYNFLCKKHGLSVESTVHSNELNEEDGQFSDTQEPQILSDLNRKFLETSGSSSDMKRHAEKPVCGLSSRPPLPSMTRSGSKRSMSLWRDTRSRQYQPGHDPHDDFLDTPFGNIQEKINDTRKEDIQDLCTDTKLQSPTSRPREGEFKYVEPVRKKAQRELLQGVECRQCEKFYDAVLPDDEKEGGAGGRRSFRCEHHDGVSRHRYRFAPPLTPEGFWDLGFESEK